MILVNGRPADAISVSERAAQFGDGVFESLAVAAGEALCLDAHLARLQAGCRRLGIADMDMLAVAAECGRLAGQQTDGIIKIIISRGQSVHGYQIPAGIRPSRILIANPRSTNKSLGRTPDRPRSEMAGQAAAEAIAVCLCRTPLGRNPVLAGIKHLNRLEQVLARREVQAQRCDEGIALDVDGNVVEGTASNVFLLFDDTLVTPDLCHAGVAGIVRAEVLLLAERLGINAEVRPVRASELAQATALFFTNSISGVQAVREYDGKAMPIPPVIDTIRSSLRQARVIPA